VAFALAFHPAARKEFLRLISRDQEDFEAAIRSLQEYPFRSGPGFVRERLGGSDDLWKVKLRHPQRRAYFRVEGRTIRMLGFGPRAEFYLRLQDRARRSSARDGPPP
jgi:mRNA-degrading endonuclease RelE of RelBE toxin-antitoxin system